MIANCVNHHETKCAYDCVYDVYDVAIVNFHIEPYEGRSARTLKNDIEAIIAEYGSHPACYKHKVADGRELPLIYVYDSYHTKAEEWRQLLTPSGSLSIRNTRNDAVVIALYVDRKDASMLNVGGFDGIYTYFASTGFTEGSTLAQWPALSATAKLSNAMFIPSVGPGYDDTRIRPWNAVNTKPRQDGLYYDAMWQAAVTLDPPPAIVTITSFNEWHEGTQIESSKPFRSSDTGHQYADFAPRDAHYYLDLTRKWVERYNPSIIE